MMDSQVPPHHVWRAPSHSTGRGFVRAGAVSEGGANRSVISLQSVRNNQGMKGERTGRLNGSSTPQQ